MTCRLSLPQLLNVDSPITSSVNVFISPEPNLDSLHLRGDCLDGSELAREIR